MLLAEREASNDVHSSGKFLCEREGAEAADQLQNGLEEKKENQREEADLVSDAEFPPLYEVRDGFDAFERGLTARFVLEEVANGAIGRL